MTDITQHTEQSPLAHAILSNIAGTLLPISAMTDLSLLDAKAVSAIVSVKPGTLRQWVRDKTFPAPIRISSKCSRWSMGSVKAWLQFQLYAEPGDTFRDPHAGVSGGAQAANGVEAEQAGGAIALQLLNDLRAADDQGAAARAIRAATLGIAGLPRSSDAAAGFGVVLSDALLKGARELRVEGAR